jgi:hypothetical protein
MATRSSFEKLRRNDLCPCGSGRRFQEVLHENGKVRRIGEESLPPRLAPASRIRPSFEANPLSDRLSWPWPAGAISARPRGGDWVLDEMRDLGEFGVDVVVSMLMPSEAESFELGGTGNWRSFFAPIGSQRPLVDVRTMTLEWRGQAIELDV